MLLILGIVAAIITFVIVALILISNSANGAGGNGMSIWPALIIGCLVAAALITIHYVDAN